MNAALITGTSKGLGLELVKQLLSRNYRVIGVSRSPCPINHDNYFHLTTDITSEEYPQLLQDIFLDKGFSRLDVLINNAGVGATGFDIETIDVNELRSQFELHCVSAFKTVQVLCPYLDNSKIVNITSRLGSTKLNARGDFNRKGFSYAYRIAKAAQNMLSLCLAGDDKLSSNLVISIIPGLLCTDSGSSDAKNTAEEGAQGVLDIIFSAPTNGIYHAFGHEAEY
ncbi:SDR family NAD(P)-dependent oxidoreductase [Acaryochloris marina]|uniref:SDR family NAD(P)-dependent oxidoreductase n=1 Tax=Acaryochloris marina TaxID=155978 RepID=UPI0021C42B8D|nr:SDR family NAD(P)-dependent oxidoreductase [Acaryochloris marina]BDM81350.1 short-chain dehydrogenase [Acaryochloris marina MBIC10699]